MKQFRAELHIHSILSPCASRINTPRALIESCLQQGIEIAAITDHNSGENAEVFLRLAEENGIFAVPGMEMETMEGVHLLTLFPSLFKLQNWQQKIYSALPPRNFPVGFNPQEVVKKDGKTVKRIEKYDLSASTSITLEEAVNYVQAQGGMVIPAHINREFRGLLNQMGGFPGNIPFDALEITPGCNLQRLKRNYPDLVFFPVIKNGDAHHPREILGLNSFYIQKLSFEELRKAFHGEEGRKAVIIPGN